MRTRLSRSTERDARVGRIAGEAFGRNEILTKVLSNLWYADGRRAEATCKAFRALHAPVEKARKSYLRAYLRRPRRHWQAAGRGHPGFGREGSPERQRRLDQRRAPSTPEGQRIINTSGLPRMVDPEASARNAWLAHLAGRGLPPDWTYRDLEGHH